jgi:hypothetical protein
MPVRRKTWLNIDFAAVRKIGPGTCFHAARPARQKLPDAAILAGPGGQIIPLFIKGGCEKLRKTAKNIGSRRHSVMFNKDEGAWRRAQPALTASSKNKGRCKAAPHKRRREPERHSKKRGDAFASPLL